ncbi:hypothetical protein SARC_11732, partial [Sphaeroforma arctica JP610]
KTPTASTAKSAPQGLLTLRVRIVDSGAVRSMQFDPSVILYDVCKEILEKLGEKTNLGLDHGLFRPEDDYSRGVWLNAGRTLEYYDLKNGDLVEYKKKHRPLKVILMDGSQRTVLIDDSQNVGQIIKVICSRINLSNPDEFSLTTGQKKRPFGEDDMLSESDDDDVDEPNSCTLVWEGIQQQPAFTEWLFKRVTSTPAAREYLEEHSMANLFDLALTETIVKPDQDSAL